MAISTLHRLDKVVMPAGGFPVITNQRWTAGIEEMLERPAGHPFPMFVANMRQRPTVEFSTPMLATLLGMCGIGGAAIAPISTYFKRATTTGSVARGTLSHKRITINSAIVYWTQIRLTHNGKGEAQVMIAVNYDGVNAPFVYTGGVALSGNLTASEFFGLGPVAVNGVLIPGAQELTIASGIQLVQEGDASEVYDTFTGIEQGEPNVTIQTKEMVNWGTLGLNGVALDGADGLEFYARAFKNEDSRFSDAASEHIFFQGLRGKAQPQDTNGEGVTTLTDTLKCTLIAGSDSVDPLIATTSVPIT